MSESLFRSPVVVIDTETTGFLRERTAAPVEVGAVLLGCDGEVLDTFEALVRPAVDDERHDGTWAWHAERGTGLTRELVADAPDAAEVVAALTTWLEGHGSPYLTAFNVSFDQPMLERIGFHWERWGPCIMLRTTTLMARCGKAHIWPSGEAKWANAEEAIAFFGLELPHTHRALADAHNEAAILVALRRRELAGEAPDA